MEAAKNFNISMVRGDTLAFGFEVDGVDQIDSAFFSCKINADDENYIFQKSLDEGISEVRTGQYRVRVAPEDTEGIEAGSYYYDLEIGANDDIYTIMKGRLKIEQDITKGEMDRRIDYNDLINKPTKLSEFENDGVFITRDEMIDIVYPVGAIYMSVSSTSPATLFGGTWEQLSNRFLVGAGTTYTAGSTGGSASHSHTTGDHTLTIDEIPSHNHTVYLRSDVGIVSTLGLKAESGQSMPSDIIYDTGGGQAHNHGDTSTESNLPPYLAVYMWKRTA